jgi:hypothetical protein
LNKPSTLLQAASSTTSFSSILLFTLSTLACFPHVACLPSLATCRLACLRSCYLDGIAVRIIYLPTIASM